MATTATPTATVPATPPMMAPIGGPLPPLPLESDPEGDGDDDDEDEEEAGVVAVEVVTAGVQLWMVTEVAEAMEAPLAQEEQPVDEEPREELDV